LSKERLELFFEWREDAKPSKGFTLPKVIEEREKNN